MFQPTEREAGKKETATIKNYGRHPACTLFNIKEKTCTPHKLALQNYYDLIDLCQKIRWWRSDIKILTGGWSNRRLKRLVLPCDHARSSNWFKMFMISHNLFMGDLPQQTQWARWSARSFHSLKFLTPGTNDVRPASSLSLIPFFGLIW